MVDEQLIYKWRTDDFIEISVYAKNYDQAKQRLEKIMEDCGRGKLGYTLLSVEEC